jgi:hypothetical protein
MLCRFYNFVGSQPHCTELSVSGVAARQQSPRLDLPTPTIRKSSPGSSPACLRGPRKQRTTCYG